MKIWLGRVLVAVALGACSIGTTLAQSGEAIKDLAGNWVYRLGPNALFALHLETDPSDPSKIRGYFLHPENFNLNFINGTIMQFSKITNQSQRDALVSNGWQNDSLRLKETSPSDPKNEVAFSVRLANHAHLNFSMFPPFPPLSMERIAEEPRLADNWDSNRNYTPDDFVTDNPQMAAIAAADQADRKDSLHTDWSKVEHADAERRLTAASLLSQGQLHTGHDFESAALVFQHGSTPDDYLLAHTLAMVAVSKGQNGAVWISAATLDRYLQSVHQPQIFGTQLATPDKEATSQEPYNRKLISDSLRQEMAVPDLAAQDIQRQEYDSQRGITTKAP
jgi:hypothetical protein